MRSLLLSSGLLLLAACAEQGPTANPSSGSAPVAVDLGNSSRVPQVAGRTGEGEGSDALQQPTPRQAPMASVNAGSGKSAPNAATPPANQGVADHSKMDHSQMDHSQMDHGGSTSATPGGRQ